MASAAPSTGLIIPHYDAAPHYGTIIEPGMTFTVEPDAQPGTHTWDMWPDKWTVVTRDKRRSAQFEHTILITEHGNEILTSPDPATPATASLCAPSGSGSSREGVLLGGEGARGDLGGIPGQRPQHGARLAYF